ncbi:peptidylprolyl isomerase [Chrysiogenes arsenatis]|uniref:peptidylprolyl isomerase n=1 Tax=Chrysiogenes arsenatis TaxID=309797 RepID=UPI000429E640|nr:SurA N-terminal domain-containing protein [Chrysiogenes arsenatis]
MIHAMRNAGKPVKIVLWLVVVTFVASIFVVWGIQGGSQGTASYVVRVNDTEIGPNDFNRAYSSVADSLSSLLDPQSNPQARQQIREIVISNLINRALLLQEAKKSGIRVSDQELLASIAGISAFQVDGKFDAEQYKQVLSANRLVPTKFEDSQREALLVEKMERRIMASLVVGEDDLQREYQWQYGKVGFDYLFIAPDQFKDQVDLSEDKVRQYFDNNQEQYRTRESAAISYVSVPFTDDLESQRAAAETLNQLKAQIGSGGDFEFMAKQTGGEFVKTGIFETVNPPDDIASEGVLLKELSLMQNGDYSSVIRGTDRAFLVRKDESYPAAIVPFEEVRDQVVEDFTAQEIQRIAAVRAEEYANKELSEIARLTGAAIDSSEPAPYNSAEAGMFFGEEVMRKIFEATPGQTLGPVSVIGVPVFLQVTQKIDPDMTAFDEKKEELRQYLARKKGSEYLAKWLEERRMNAKIDVNRALFID